MCFLIIMCLTRVVFPRCRLLLPNQSPYPSPINLTIFRRASSGAIGEQLATSGAYSDDLSGVTIGEEKLDAGLYLLVISAWDVGMGTGLAWELRVFSEGALSAALCEQQV